MVASGVKRYQITIDGDRTTHNIRRPLKNNESSWDRTVEGIINLLDYEADITIRINHKVIFDYLFKSSYMPV